MRLYEIPELERCLKNDISQAELKHLKKKKYKEMKDELEELVRGVAYLQGDEVKQEQKNHHLHPADCVCLVADEKFVAEINEEIKLRIVELKVLKLELEDLFQ